VVGGVVPVINVPGVKAGEVTLSGELLGDIYLGKIKKWNDPAIAALNPKVKLPDTDIAVVRRADGSGTSFIWTNYLSKVNPEWKSKVGEGSTVNWPTGTGGKGNDGVAAFVQRLPGAIGYVEWAYAKQNKMTYVDLKNAAGTVVEPKTETFKAAAAGADWSKSFYQILTNESGKNAWPIVGATFVLLHATQEKAPQGTETLKFFDWAFKNGGQAANDLDYISLPESVVAEIRTQWTAVARFAARQVPRGLTQGSHVGHQSSVDSACERHATCPGPSRRHRFRRRDAACGRRHAAFAWRHHRVAACRLAADDREVRPELPLARGVGSTL
jgi:phosphate transport system substrate-binding protein